MTTFCEVVPMKRCVASVALVVLLASCTADPGDSATSGTTMAADGWERCTTRLDFDRVVLDVADPNAAVRVAALSTAEAIPLPTGLEQGWTTLVAILKRYVDLAGQVQETDPVAFRQAVDQLAGQDAAMTSLNGLTNEDEQQAIGELRYATPCDSTDLPADFGCDEPQACTEDWIHAFESQSDTAMGRLGSVWLKPADTAVTDLQLGSCAEAVDRPGVQRCTFMGFETKGSVDWLLTTDGRWYGLDSRVSASTPVETAPP
jgi:hypothetical protein